MSLPHVRLSSSPWSSPPLSSDWKSSLSSSPASRPAKRVGRVPSDTFHIEQLAEREGYQFLRDNAHQSDDELLSAFADQDDSGEILRTLSDPQGADEAARAWTVLSSLGSAGRLDWSDPTVALDLPAGVQPWFGKMNWEQLEQTVRASNAVHRTGGHKLRAHSIFRDKLEDECSLRMSADKSLANADERRAEIFRMAYLWLSRARGLFINQLLASLLWEDKLLGRLSPQELVFVIYLLGSARVFPSRGETVTGRGRNAGKRIRNVNMPRHLAAHIERALPQLSLGEVGVICHSMYMSKVRLHPDVKSLSSALLRLVAQAEDRELVENSTDVNSICKTLQFRGIFDFRLSERVIDKFARILEDVSPLVRIRLVAAFADNSPKNHGPLVDELARTTLHETQDLRLKDLERLTFLLYHLNYRGPPSIYESIMAAALCRKEENNFATNGRSFLYLTSFLSKAGHFFEPAIREIFSSANTNETLRFAVTDKELVNAAADWLCGLVGSNAEEGGEQEVERRTRKQQEREVLRSTVIYYNVLFHAAELDCNVEAMLLDPRNSYSGPRLDPELRRRWLQLGVASEAEGPTAMDRLRESVAEDLRELFAGGRRESVAEAKLFPHATTKDVVLCLDVGNNKRAQILSDRGVESLSESVTRPTAWKTLENEEGAAPPVRPVFVAVLIPKRSHIDGNARPLGPLWYKRDLLQRLSYRVVIVKPHAYEAARRRAGQEATTKYLLDLVKLAVKR